MKKVLCMFVVIAIFAGFCVSAETLEIGAAMDTDYYNVYISGKSELISKPVTFMLIDENNNPGYVREFKTDKSGEYELKFKFDGNINDYRFMLRDSETAADITGTVRTSFAKHELYGLDVTLMVDGNDIIGTVADGSKADVLLEIHNKYGNDSKVNVLLAAYDENNKLINVQKESFKLDYNDLNTYKTVEFKDVYVPAGTLEMKAFAWTDTVNLIPLAEGDEAAASDDKIFKNENSDNSEWVVGLMGDSITHMGNYNVFLYHYYSTRHPGSNIRILNRGISGSKSQHQMFRLEMEALNPDDPFYGECDEIMLMVGMNDIGAGATVWPLGKLKDEEYLEMYPELQGKIDNCIANIEEVVQHCISKDKKITLVTPSLHDEHESFATVFGTNYGLGILSEGIKELGEKYNVPVLDVYKASNLYTDRIRTENPEATTVITETDSTHPDGPGGYLLGYIFARAQETSTTVASVEIDASTTSVNAENAEVSDVNASSSFVSYEYLPKALPLYAEAAGYKYVKDFGVDITNTMNREMIKVSNLADGIYSVKMDDTEIGKYTDDELLNGINIAELANNPGQIQSKNTFDIVTKIGDLESNYRVIKFVENAVVNYSSTPWSKYYESAIKRGTDYKNYTDEDWYNTVLDIRSIYENDTPQAEWNNSQPIQWIVFYLHDDWRVEYDDGVKKYEDTIINNIKNYHLQLEQESIPVSHSVEISIVQ